MISLSLPQMRLIAPFGFYGWGNIGDEATLQGFARLVQSIEPRVDAWVGARNPSHCRIAEPQFRYFQADARRSLRRHLAWRMADAMVVPGGTPISSSLGAWPLAEVAPLVQRAAKLHLPVAFVGVGVEELGRDEAISIMTDVMAPLITAWSVRSERDRDRLARYGVHASSVTVAADMAWALHPARRDAGVTELRSLGIAPDAFVIGVNLNFEGYLRREHPGILKELAVFLEEAAEELGARVLFFCNEVREGETFDMATSRSIIALMSNGSRCAILPNHYRLPQEMMSIVASCDMTITTRYHFAVFSALQGIPFIAIERSDKIADLTTDLGWPYSIPLPQVSATTLLNALHALQTNMGEASHALGAAVVRLRERTRCNSIPLRALIR